MLASIARIRLGQTSPCQLHRSFTFAPVSNYVKLAYDLHKPAKDTDDASTRNAPIIFIHGLFGSKKNNRSMSKVLARDLKRSVYAVDLRNHGDSAHDSRHDYTALAEDVEGFIDEHGLEKPTLIGHSMGAKTAMTVALRSPHKIANLVSIDNAPVDAALKSDFAKYVQAMKRVEEAGVKRQSEADEILKEYEESLPIRQFLLTNLLRTPANTHRFRIPLRHLAAALPAMADFPFRDPDAARFEGPALFVRGTKSHYVPDETLPIIGRFFPRFRVVDIEAGHWVVSEAPEEFRKAVVEFLQDKD
ncbi:hypothetical protein B0A49_00711 [Cryomyces minteri]|uniref:AB hydrolase-1 domain-containing protein n=1 Tax=Cryomyces minteri TaxID=331657 RepID=A0A4U0XTU3_9PEZI|nr:hypothetical protein B0A49_00711 [Cryomyces minteri]